MKRYWILLVLFSVVALPLWAQDEDPVPQDPKVRDKINAARAAYITERLGLTPEEAEKFWPIYREFSEKRDELHKEFNTTRRNPDPNKTTEENDRALVDLRLRMKQQELDLEKTYSARLLQVISAQKLTSLRQAENDFRVLILRQIQQRQLQQDRRQQLRDRSQQKLQQRNN
ncbi:MAG: hypothetical protein HC859_14575 [Bacteroidia bacterium]|nr:hypothetical protein [Bacteroidia bacterium]